MKTFRETSERIERPSVIDAGIALAIAVAGAVDVFGSDVYRPRGLWVFAVIGTAGTILWRRRAPVIVLAAVLLLQAVAHLDRAVDDPAFQFFAIFTACFSVGAYARLRSSIAALVAAIVFFAVFNLSRGADWGTAAFGGVLFWGAWGIGIALRYSEGRRREVEAQAIHLEFESAERTRMAIADERARIARELHDAVAHNVSVMVLQVGAVRRRLSDDQVSEREFLKGVEDAGREAVTELHRMLGLLRTDDSEAALAARPSLDRLGDLLEQVRNTGLVVDLTVEGDPRSLPAGIDVSAFRIVQEALTNVLKHARGATATVRVVYGVSELELEIVDTGGSGRRGEVGNGNGHGLIGMQERVALFGGSLRADQDPSGGFAVRARLPL
ncbi:MAG: sensor histidine kinase [Actinobacteria bacterium]|nr:sensor histidine kinase [Actinomycetota bacterium]